MCWWTRRSTQTHSYFLRSYHITDRLLTAGNKNKLLNQCHLSMNIFTVSQFQSSSSNGQPTIEFKDRRLDFLADSATGLMFYDIQDIVDAYNCTGKIYSIISYAVFGSLCILIDFNIFLITCRSADWEPIIHITYDFALL